MDVIWQPNAVKQLKKIGDRAAQKRILSATLGLSMFPACTNVKRLIDHEPTHRLRGEIGGYSSMYLRRSALSVLKR